MSRISFRQWFYAFTGDRKREAEALAKDVVAARTSGPESNVGDPSPALVASAENAVRAAHGDLGIEEHEGTTASAVAVGDVAAIDDVADPEVSAGSESPARVASHDSDPGMAD